MRFRALAVAAVFVGLPASTVADEPAFAPRVVDTGLTVELFASREENSHEYQSRPFRWADDFFKQKISGFASGYWYHPRFLQYHASLGGGFKQESFSFSPLDRKNRNTGTSIEYDARLSFLPQHAYNFELFGRRYEPLVRQESASRQNTMETNRGALFRYRRREVFFHARLTDDKYHADGSSSKVTRYGVDAEYLKSFRNGNQLTFTLAANPSSYSNTSGVEGTTSDVIFSNMIDLQRVRLNSSVSRSAQDQESGGRERFETRQFVWYERLNVYLPWNFRSDLSYRYQDADRTIKDDLFQPERTLEDTSKDVQFHLVHRLFESLDSNYTYLHGDRTSSSGESTAQTHALAFNYTKKIPVGRLLSGVSWTRSETENTGRADVVDEVHPGVAVPGLFRLNEPNVTPGSVVLFLKSPLPPYDAVRLDPDVHYSVTEIGSTVEINVFSLPPDFVVPGTYDFTVSYTLLAGDFRFRSKTTGGNLSVELFDTRVVPYVGYVTVRTDVLEGLFPGVPLDSTTKTAGLILRMGKIRALGEYQKVDWNVNPYRAYKAEVQYVGAIGPTSNLYLRGVYLDKYYTDGTPYGTGVSHDDKSYSASGSLQKNFLQRRLVFSVGGGGSKFKGQLDSTSYYANSSLTWRIGRLEVIGGANISNSDSKGSTGIQLTRDHKYYFVQLRRQFF